MKSKGIGSSGKIRPIIPLFVHQESFRRHDSLSSFTDMCSEDGVDLNQKFDPEKQDSYLNLSIADVGGTLADVKDDIPLSPAPSSVYSIPPPPPARTYGNSRIEIPEKQDSYLNLSIADFGGTLADVKDDTPLSPAPSSVYSIPPPPARTYGNSRIEISSVYRDSTYIEPNHSLAVPISKSS
jgi:hypothetical protein